MANAWNSEKYYDAVDFLSFFNLGEGKTVIDLGAGDFPISRRFLDNEQNKDMKLVCVDYDAKGCMKAKRVFNEKGYKVAITNVFRKSMLEKNDVLILQNNIFELPTELKGDVVFASNCYWNADFKIADLSEMSFTAMAGGVFHTLLDHTARKHMKSEKSDFLVLYWYNNLSYDLRKLCSGCEFTGIKKWNPVGYDYTSLGMPGRSVLELVDPPKISQECADLCKKVMDITYDPGVRFYKNPSRYGTSAELWTEGARAVFHPLPIMEIEVYKGESLLGKLTGPECSKIGKCMSRYRAVLA